MSVGTALSVDPSSYESLGALLNDALLTWKGETALIESNRARETGRRTYLETWHEAHRLAALLRSHGVGPGDRVAILASNGSRWLIAAIGAYFLGAVLVPLDYKLTPPEWVALLRHARPIVLLTEPHIAASIREHGVDIVLSLDGELPAASPGGEGRVEIATRLRNDPAAIVYSSGTGGRPKGCVLPHRAYLHQLAALISLYPMRPGQRFFSFLPTNHAIDFVAGFLGPLVCGATVVHQRTLRPEFLIATFQRYAPSHTAVVPSLLTAFEKSAQEKLDALPGWQGWAVDAATALNRQLRGRPMLKPLAAGFGGSLEVMFCGGAFTDRRRAEWFGERGLPVVIGYGLTECCAVATLNGTKPLRADSVGRAVDGVEVAIHSPDAAGVGEVWIRGPTVMLGYLDDPVLTAETLTPDGWLRTGDLGWLDGSFHLHLVGRNKDVIVTDGGKNVYPEDVEAAFAALDCEELAIFSESYVWPQRKLTGERLVAVVRPRGELPVEALRQVNRSLADFKRLSGVLAWPDGFPRTATMKLKRSDLAARVG
ncbi:MAG: AMP-binding protein, partial [Deltaproteobacteria bacterium]|nr:AMP-binding protein [Deltaproteobacteria bacterium]